MRQELLEAYDAKREDDEEILELKKEVAALGQTRSVDQSRITELEESIARY
jgi:predicted type IV restriction endonuclease